MRFVLLLHLTAMAFWLGGQLFLAAVAIPAVRHLEPEQRRDVIRRVGRGFGNASIVALLVLVATGVWMLLDYDLSPSDNSALRHKLELIGLVVVATVVHVVAGARGAVRVSRITSLVTLLATLGVVWFATGI